jgi:hypothetical protein
MPWIAQCVGAAMFGTALGDTSLTHISDSYREVSKPSACFHIYSSLTKIVDPRRLSHRNSLCAKCLCYHYRLCTNPVDDGTRASRYGCLALFLNMLVVPMIIWGKRFRILCAKRYAVMDRQFDARAINLPSPK